MSSPEITKKKIGDISFDEFREAIQTVYKKMVEIEKTVKQTNNLYSAHSALVKDGANPFSTGGQQVKKGAGGSKELGAVQASLGRGSIHKNDHDLSLPPLGDDLN